MIEPARVFNSFLNILLLKLLSFLTTESVKFENNYIYNFKIKQEIIKISKLWYSGLATRFFELEKTIVSVKLTQAHSMNRRLL